jgi:hypothetical protein
MIRVSCKKKTNRCQWKTAVNRINVLLIRKFFTPYRELISLFPLTRMVKLGGQISSMRDAVNGREKCFFLGERLHKTVSDQLPASHEGMEIINGLLYVVWGGRKFLKFKFLHLR